MGTDIRLPVGTRIEFIETLTDGPDEHAPSRLYATKGERGEITGYGCREGYWVKTNNWPAAFGAVHGIDFIAVEGDA